jgi:electron transfer flavoprotein alpha subunit
VAFRLGTAAATACEEIADDGARLLFTRGCYGGNARESLSFRTVPAVATVRAGAFEAPAREPGRNGELLRVELAPDAPVSRLKVVARERTASDAMRLEEARVVVAGGRGLEGPEGFVLLGKLAEVLGGAVGASRVPCDLGWCPHSMQIGLTGKTVTPELYIAVGISGAGHHMAGCGSARNIVAINTDREAAIYKEARWGVVGDYRQVIPPLIAAIRALRSAERKSNETADTRR